MPNENIASVLGEKIAAPKTYDPTILVREPRQRNRDHLNINSKTLPFAGFDTWNAYECSFLNGNGLPISGCLKLMYPCTNDYIVESKSIKLYLNSYNMHVFSENPEKQFQKMVEKDLSKLLDTRVKTGFFPFDSYKSPDVIFGNEYVTLENLYDEQKFDTYTETPSLLQDGESEPSVCRYHSALLRSNCKITSQADWGDIYIAIYHSGNTSTVCPKSLLKYIVSFRDECHFHEEVVEAVYCRLWERFKPGRLEVTALYARRGGIDINPCRVSHPDLFIKDLMDVNVPHCKTPKQ